MIYFVKRLDSNLIKIGTTTQISKRLKKLTIEYNLKTEVRLLAVMDGSFYEENYLHRKFAALHVNGEWFEAGKELVEFIEIEGHEWNGVDEKPDPSGIVFHLSQTAILFLFKMSQKNNTSITAVLEKIIRAAISSSDQSNLK